jgi:hypothetical protein
MDVDGCVLTDGRVPSDPTGDSTPNWSWANVLAQVLDLSQHMAPLRKSACKYAPGASANLLAGEFNCG